MSSKIKNREHKIKLIHDLVESIMMEELDYLSSSLFKANKNGDEKLLEVCLKRFYNFMEIKAALAKL